jgi:hypothetical protein
VSAAPATRSAQVRKAEAKLAALLRTPKSRRGLIAAVAGHQITKHFVFGWLSQQLQEGTVARLKSSGDEIFQLASCIEQERAKTKTTEDYPDWLEPRALPPVASRRVYFAAKIVEG